jgi:hypothetical protein
VREGQLLAQLRVLGPQPFVLLEHAAQPGTERLLAGALARCRPRPKALLLGAQLLDRGAQLGMAVEEASADAGFAGDCAEGHRLAAPVELGQGATGAFGGVQRAGGRCRAQRICSPAAHSPEPFLVWSWRRMASSTTSMPADTSPWVLSASMASSASRILRSAR